MKTISKEEHELNMKILAELRAIAKNSKPKGE